MGWFDEQIKERLASDQEILEGVWPVSCWMRKQPRGCRMRD